MKAIATIRSAIFWALLVISVIFSALFIFCAIPFTSQEWRYRFCSGWCRFTVKSLRLICGVQYEFENLQSVPKDKPIILLSKHQSAWETIALTGFVPRRLSFVYKRELHRLPLFGQVLASLGMFSVDRARGRAAFAQMKEEVPEYFSKGWILVLFPEGTRTAPGQVIKYKSGGARVAIDTGVPVIPVALNSGEYWPRNSFCKYPGTIKVVFGPMISSENKTSQELNEEVQTWIENKMKELSPKYYR